MWSERKSESGGFHNGSKENENDDGDMNNSNGTMERASKMDDYEELTAWSRTPGFTDFNRKSIFARSPLSKNRRNMNAVQSNGAASVPGEHERIYQPVTAASSASSVVELNNDDILGRTRAGDVAEQTRKKWQRVGLRELHLAD